MKSAFFENGRHKAELNVSNYLMRWLSSRSQVMISDIIAVLDMTGMT